jgi:hypothetical protein
LDVCRAMIGPLGRDGSSTRFESVGVSGS